MIFEKQMIGVYKGMMFTRCDDNQTAFYFSAEDFPGLQKESYAFRASAGHTLQGYLYHYDNPIAGRIVVFDHGFGGGHRSYLREIEKLCKHGYLVFAYDHTGCMESGGDTPNGMAQSLCDLNDCITTLKNDDRFAGLDISVMGHSWGGFSTSNISALHPEISHVVVLSGFVSVELLVGSFFSGLMKNYRKPIMEVEKAANPRFVEYNAVKTLSQSKAKVLLVYSDDDQMCKKDVHYDTLWKGLSQQNNIRFLLVNHKGHNPNYTEDAVQYLGEYTSLRTKLMKKKKLQTAEQKQAFVNSFDWKRMTEQDETVWSEIFSCLDS
jgi:pimeloyl-ACP methyl ester carboxylesterase